MSSTKPPAFEICFEGDDISPETVPVRALAEALSAFQRLAAGPHMLPEDDGDADGEEPAVPEEHSLSLVRIRNGSAVYRVAGPPPDEARENLEFVARLLEDPDSAPPGFDELLVPIRRISDVARRFKCQISARVPGRRHAPGAVLATIGPTSFEEVANSIYIKGKTSFVGRVERVGGANRRVRCCIRPNDPGARLLYCDVDGEDVARRIGESLYHDVEVKGLATWFRGSWKLADFRIESVRPAPVQGDLLDALKELREAAGSAWDDIDDVTAYLDKIRGE